MLSLHTHSLASYSKNLLSNAKIPFGYQRIGVEIMEKRDISNCLGKLMLCASKWANIYRF